MADIFSKKKRSQIMSRITGKNTKPELFIRKLLYSEGYRYRLYGRNLPGNPDIVFPYRKKTIFVNGCFWHGHTCKKATLPATNKSFWKKKIDGNKKRDKKNLASLKKIGWQSLVIWQCKIKKGNNSILNRIVKFLRN